jgi:7-cyano-7-deazaguanine tRNA-ribosyltransferase
VQVVAGLSLKNLKPRVWDPASSYYLPELRAVMVSYADFDKSSAKRRAAMQQTLHGYLGTPKDVQIYLDNGAFYFLGRDGGVSQQQYEAFVLAAQPDWYPIPQDFIPVPQMDDTAQIACLQRTMDMNRAYQHDGFVPVIHISRQLNVYLEELLGHKQLSQKERIALGGIVPNLLRMPKAMPYADVLRSLRHTRQELAGKHLHVFGLGGTATLHLAALFGIDSLDSSGWRNRAARGIVQLPGRGDRMVANMGSWRGREPDAAEWAILAACPCPACQLFNIAGLKTSGIDGFCNRATHNLWILLREAQEIETHLRARTYHDWYLSHVDNSIYRALIRDTLTLMDVT